MARGPGVGYTIALRLLRMLVRPRASGHLPTPATDPTIEQPLQPIYVLERRSLSDLLVLDLICATQGLPSPFAELSAGDIALPRRVFYLDRYRRGGRRRRADAARVSDVEALLERGLQTGIIESTPVLLLPVTVFWGLVPSGQGSFLRLLLSEHWAVTSRLRRIVNLFLSPRQIIVDFGVALPLADACKRVTNGKAALERINRTLRIRLRHQRAAALGPDLSHQRTLLARVVQGRPVRAVIEAAPDTRSRQRLEREARRYAEEIASNISFPTVRILEQVLRWFWNRIYSGVSVSGIEQVKSIAGTHTLVYVPSHRSHLDYLLLSYLLYQQGLTIPHIAAGRNLNLPVVGGILRRSGAFFMRRSFRGDPLYSAVFSEYLYQVYRRGHSVEFFPEGGRSRTGRLLPARLGLIKMTLEHHARGLPRPLAFVPVYFGYEKLVEAASYLDELRGSGKQTESVSDVFRALRLVRQNFGHVEVRFGAPLVLGHWLREQALQADPSHDTTVAPRLGAAIMARINAAATVNPVNLVALVMLSAPRLAIESTVLEAQIALYQRLLQTGPATYPVTALSPTEVIATVQSLGLIQREETAFGPVVHHDPLTAVLITWYRNNVAHVLLLPSLIACLIRNRRRPIDRTALNRLCAPVLPFAAEAVTAEVPSRDIEDTREAESAAHPEQRHVIDTWVDCMLNEGLLVERGEALQPAAADSEQGRQLHLLAGVVMPLLERLYIVLRLITIDADARQSRDALQERTIAVAARMSRLYGLNAPEFVDATLFNQIVDGLLKRGLLQQETDGRLLPGRLVPELLRAANAVIDAEFRLAVKPPPELPGQAAPPR
ncbi:MAG: glycerol-3-phosphate 1-O-acyltransferase PlsB [Pseudomonadales bacterium]